MLPSGPIIRSRAKKFRATISLFIQKQVTQEFNELSFNKFYMEHEGTPKLLLLLEVCVEDVVA